MQAIQAGKDLLEPKLSDFILYIHVTARMPAGNYPDSVILVGAVRQPDKAVLAGTGTYPPELFWQVRAGCIYNKALCV